MSDLGTVMWKEWRELRAQSGELGPKTTIVLMVALLGAVGMIAVIAGPFVIHTPILVVIAYAPMVGVIGVICDSFAGERERHTLETLLASRIRSEALLIGKMLLQVVYGYCAMLILATILIVGANVRTITESWVLPTLPVATVLFVLTPFVLLFFCALGVLVSLRAPTVRQAQSRLVLVFLGFFVSLVSLSLLGKHTAPAETLRFVQSQRGQLIIVGSWLLLFIVMDVALVLAAWARFRRDQLIEIR